MEEVEGTGLAPPTMSANIIKDWRIAMDVIKNG